MVDAAIGLEMSILLFAAMLGYVLAVRIGQPAVVGEILLGLLIGPSLFNLIHFDDLVRIVAEFGAIVLLFAIGLECKFNEIYTKKNFLIAFFGIVLPWLGGYGLAALFGFSGVVALLIGTALTATSVAVTVDVLRQLGKLKSEVAKIIIGAAVIDDILGLLVLGVTISVSSGSFTLQIIASKIFLAIAFVVIGTFCGILASKYLRRLDNWGAHHRIPQITFIAALAIAFLYSAVAEVVGLSAVVGAFIAGVSLERLNIPSYKEGSKYLEIIFASIFFVSLGILINIHESTVNVLFLLSLIFVAVFSKFVACFLTARFMGQNRQESAVIGVGMVPRGEVASIVAVIALTRNLINQEIYLAIILMGLVTTIITPIIIKKIYGVKKKPSFGFGKEEGYA